MLMTSGFATGRYQGLDSHFRCCACKRVRERQIRELSDRLEQLEERQIAEPQESTADSSGASAVDDENPDTANVAVQEMTNEVADRAERVAELEKTSFPEGPEEVSPTEVIPWKKLSTPSKSTRPRFLGRVRGDRGVDRRTVDPAADRAGVSWYSRSANGTAFNGR
ncbi:MAG: hypothetical protein CM1200mP26_28320 [Acidimicrobiales bacterium]|nr:MAG: hypothetical protein CM1200mP26_28320 [Acidimicrobiales bacterium]